MLSARMNEGGDPARPATTMGDSAKTRLDYIAEDVIKRFFSLENSRPLGVQTWFLPLLLVQPELRMQRVFYAAEVISLTAGLFLFFCQGLVGFVPGMKDLGFISAILASAGCIVIITTIIMVLLVALFNSVSPASPTATVIGAAQPLAFCAFWFFAAIHLVYVAFALHVVDTCGGAMGLALGILSIFLLFFVHMFVGWNFDVIIPLPWYHQTRMFTEVFRVPATFAWLRTRRPLRERAEEQLVEYLRIMPDDVRRIVEGKVGV